MHLNFLKLPCRIHGSEISSNVWSQIERESQIVVDKILFAHKLIKLIEELVSKNLHAAAKRLSAAFFTTNLIEEIKVAVRTVPSFNELISDQKKMTDIQNLSLDDLLPRARVKNDFLLNIHDKTLFISGAGGSIGSELSIQIASLEPKLLICFDILHDKIHSFF